MNSTTNNNFKDNLHEAIKTFLTLAVLIFLLVSSFYVLAKLFPINAQLEPDYWGLRPFVFGYIVAIPFMTILSLYPFGKK